MSAMSLTALAPRAPLSSRLTALPTALIWAPVAAFAAAAPAYFALIQAHMDGGLWPFGLVLLSHQCGLLALVLRLRSGRLRDRAAVVTTFVLAAIVIAVPAAGTLAVLGPPGSWALAPVILALAILQGVMGGLLTALAGFGEMVEPS